MKISTIIWAKVEVVSPWKCYDWEDCTINFNTEEKTGKGTAWIQRIERGMTTEYSLLVGITKVLTLTPWNFKALGTISDGEKLIIATIEATF